MPPLTGDPPLRRISRRTARRLFVTKQVLAAPVATAASTDDLLSVVRRLGCLQLDPISVVARSHRLVLWSRVGPFDLSLLDRLLWDERRLFEYWAHAASIVLTEDYGIHAALMRRYGSGDLIRHRRLRAWIRDNDELRRQILRRLRREGPLRSRDFEGRSDAPWTSSGWTSDQNVGQMIDYLWTKGRIMVVRRDGLQKVWDLSERWLPDWTPRQRLSWREIVRRSAIRSLGALGTGTARHIQSHFTVGRYPGLPGVLHDLVREGAVVPMNVGEEVGGGGADLPGPWFVLVEDLPLLERIEGDEWEGRTTLLSPFDNLIVGRDRTEQLFDFRFRMEIYVPPAKRQYGYYVLPILHGDRLIGRIDPAMDRRSGRLAVKAVHSEPGAPLDAATGRAVARAIGELATFLGATDVAFGERVPDRWRRALRA